MKLYSFMFLKIIEIRGTSQVTEMAKILHPSTGKRKTQKTKKQIASCISDIIVELVQMEDISTHMKDRKEILKELESPS